MTVQLIRILHLYKLNLMRRCGMLLLTLFYQRLQGLAQTALAAHRQAYHRYFVLRAHV